MCLPLRHVLLVGRHVDGILAGAADGVELFQQKFDEFALALRGHDGQAIDDHEGVQAFLQPDLILILQVCSQKDISLVQQTALRLRVRTGEVDVQLLLVEILVGKGVETRSHGCESSQEPCLWTCWA